MWQPQEGIVNGTRLKYAEWRKMRFARPNSRNCERNKPYKNSGREEKDLRIPGARKGIASRESCACFGTLMSRRMNCGHIARARDALRSLLRA
jgi:hypothetical protein